MQTRLRVTAMHKKRRKRKRKRAETASGSGRKRGSDAATWALSPVFSGAGQDGCAEGLNCSVPVRGLLSIVLLCLM